MHPNLRRVTNAGLPPHAMPCLLSPLSQLLSLLPHPTPPTQASNLLGNLNDEYLSYATVCSGTGGGSSTTLEGLHFLQVRRRGRSH